MDAENNRFSDDDDPIDPDYAKYLSELEAQIKLQETLETPGIDPDYALFLSKHGPGFYEQHQDSEEDNIATPELKKFHVCEFSLGVLTSCTTTQMPLPNALNDYVRRYKFQNLILHIQTQCSAKVHLHYPSDPNENVKIVRGWKQFCNDNNITLRDRLRFEFKENGDNVCDVTKLLT
ncbi:hypothetical protein TSUD_280700 [Trifolium subterraneum]|uniref:TF-B3 domain-containing protein n=1 Tax=Trifolium subterraneum TaxID=3900 RepID=A0A2Z6NVH1_TRISU|nr:hypothetical protein TSUD_280700 [Trifolium subterraneum]